jgi:hypothetical protein
MVSLGRFCCLIDLCVLGHEHRGKGRGSLPFTDVGRADLARLSCLAGTVAFVALQLRMLRHVHTSLPRAGRDPLFCAVMVAATVLSGPQLSICGRPLSGKGKRWGRCCAWSDAVICPAFDAAGRQPPACMGVRGPGPDHPKRARSTVESPGYPSPVSPTVAPYSPSARPHVLAIVVSLRRHGRSSIGAAFDQQGPDDAGHLVGQSNGD